MMQNLGQPFEASCCAAVNKDIEKIEAVDEKKA